MTRALLALTFLWTAFAQAATPAEISTTIEEEWTRLHALVNTLEPDGKVGDLYHEKKYGDVSLMWLTSNVPGSSEVIRFYLEHKDGRVFAVTYHRNSVIVPGRMVIRRFVGTEPAGWQNFTIDADTGEFLGQQGTDSPELLDQEKELMKKWDIREMTWSRH